MKTFFSAVIFVISFNSFAQQDWVNIGKEIGFDFYYKKNTVVRGNPTYVEVVGVPLQEMKDKSNDVIKYVGIHLAFYESSTGIRCLISNHMYFYENKSYKKAGLPKRDLPVTYYVLLLKLYNEIR